MVAKGSSPSEFVSFFDQHEKHIYESLIVIYDATNMDSSNLKGDIREFVENSDITGNASVNDIRDSLLRGIGYE